MADETHIMGLSGEETRRHLQQDHGRTVRSSIRDPRVLRVVHLKEHGSVSKAPTAAEEGARNRALMGGQYDESRAGHGR